MLNLFRANVASALDFLAKYSALAIAPTLVVLPVCVVLPAIVVLPALIVLPARVVLPAPALVVAAALIPAVAALVDFRRYKTLPFLDSCIFVGPGESASSAEENWSPRESWVTEDPSVSSGCFLRSFVVRVVASKWP